MIPQQLIAVALILLVWLVAFIGMREQNLLIQLAVMLAPVLFMLMGNLPMWFVIAVGINQSGLIFPGLPSGLEVSHVFMAGFVLIILASNIITKRKIQKTNYVSVKFLYFFILVVFLTIAVRGFGLRAFGGSKWGGMAYVRVLVAVGFLMAARTVTLSPRQWRSTIIIMLLCSFLPAIAQMIFMISNGVVWQQYYFIKAFAGTLISSLEASQSETGVVRYQMLAGVATAMLAPSLVLMAFRGYRRQIIYILIILVVLLAGLSGFRSILIKIVGTVGMFVFLSAKKRSLFRLVHFAAMGLIVLVLMSVFARHLPAPIQRSLTWVPFADIPMEVRLNAEVSTQWRFEIWKLAWEEVPDYLLVGKGFAIEPDVQESSSAREDSLLYAFLVHNYHSGPLSLLLDLGLMGFISATLFMVFSAIEVYRNRTLTGSDPFLRRFYLFAVANYLYSVFAYYFVFGSAASTLPDICVQFAILDSVLRTSRIAEAPVPDQQPVQGVTPPRPVFVR